MSRLLITGANGFVGRHLVQAAMAAGHEVYAAGRRPPDAGFGPAPHRFIALDLDTIPADPYRDFGRPDVVVHLAWQKLNDYFDPDHTDRFLWQHYELLRRLIEGGLPQLVVAGTCFEYGLRQGRIEESDPTEPVVPYALAKDLLHRLLRGLRMRRDYTLQWVRIFYIYGADQRAKSLYPQLLSALAEGRESFDLSPGDQLRDYLPIQRVARNLLGIAMQRQVTGAINCCSGEPRTLKDWVQQWAAEQGRAISINTGVYPYLPYEPQAFWGATEKLQAALAAAESCKPPQGESV
ncbi:MAG: NAD(P)-dependent oxidoreductase [Gammaproteobacteria bacterium]